MVCFRWDRLNNMFKTKSTQCLNIFHQAKKTSISVIDKMRESRTISPMRTVIETPTFQKQAEKLWTEDERLAFIDWIAEHPLAGDVIPGAEGARKVRWAAAGKGKRGGVRVIYFNLEADGVIVLITLYQKADQATISNEAIKKAV